MASPTEGRIWTEKSDEFWKRYRIEKRSARLGEGRYGSVWRATDEKTGETVAIKKIVMEDMDCGIPSTTMRELTILKHLQGDPNIIRLRDVFYDYERQMGERELNLVFDCLSCDLRKYIYRRSTPMPANMIKACSPLALLGLQSGMFHRDLKPQNILIDSTQEDAPNLKIGDFGLGRMHALPLQQLTHEIGSLYYRAPEILLGSEFYGHAVDMWSIGCIFAELLLRKVLFCGTNEYHQLVKIFEILGTPTSQTWPLVHTLEDYQDQFPNFKENRLKEQFKDGIDDDAFDLLEKFLAFDPVKRIHIVDTLKHPYFKEESVENQEPSSADKQNSEVVSKVSNE